MLLSVYVPCGKNDEQDKTNITQMRCSLNSLQLFFDSKIVLPSSLVSDLEGIIPVEAARYVERNLALFTEEYQSWQTFLTMREKSQKGCVVHACRPSADYGAQHDAFYRIVCDTARFF